MAQELERLPGMSEGIGVASAKSLDITAPSGKYVAVIDMRLSDPNSDEPKVQDHHNGWLQLSTDNVEGGLVLVKGKYYLPSSSDKPAVGIRFTIRRRTREGLVVYSDKTLEVDQVADRWTDFAIELPIDAEKTGGTGGFILMLSAVPFAGPVYFDNLQVTDQQHNDLWQYPEFEPE